MSITLLRKAFLSAAMALLFSASTSGFSMHAHAAASEEDQQGAVAFFQEMSDAAFAVMRNTQLSKDEQKAEFRRLFKKGTAVEQLGPLLLGYHRKRFSAEQLKRYTDLLPDYVVAIYTDRLFDVGNEEVSIQNTYTQGSSDVWIVTKVTSPIGGDDLRADWRIRRLDSGRFSLLDVKVENISLFQTKKDEFMAYLGRRGIEAFLKRLSEDVAKASS
ncbi:MAG: ABC transporter substrate-binding protein [Pseudomonadota bacterium]